MRINALAEATQLTAATLERTLETLSQSGVVSRHPGPQGAWFLTHWPETFALLNSARVLGVALQATDDHLSEEEGSLFARLEEARGAAPAARRGQRKNEEEDDG